jgi:hypothetical protein
MQDMTTQMAKHLCMFILKLYMSLLGLGDFTEAK